MRNATDHFVYMNSAAKQLAMATISRPDTTAGYVIHVRVHR